MTPVALFICPQLERLIGEHVPRDTLEGVTLIPLQGSSEALGCRLPDNSPGPEYSRVALCGPCGSGDPGIAKIMSPTIDVACCEEIVADSEEIRQALSRGSHLFLPTHSQESRDIPWQAWGFRTRESAVEYLRDNVRSLCFISDSSSVRDTPPAGLEDLPLRHIEFTPEKLRMAVTAAIDHARLAKEASDWRGRAAEYQMLLDFLVPLFHEQSVEAGVERVESLLSNTLGATIRIELKARPSETLDDKFEEDASESLAEESELAGRQFSTTFAVELIANADPIGRLLVSDIHLGQHAKRYEALLNGFAPLLANAIEHISQKKQQVESLGIYRAILQSTQEGMVITDRLARVLSVNTAFSEITGYGESEVLGRPVSLLKSGDHNAAFYDGMWSQLKERGHWLGEVINKKKSGDRYVQKLSISAVRDDTGVVTHYAGLFLDVTKENEMTHQLQRRAMHDSLTGLLNRESIDEIISSATSDRRSAQGFALVYIDVDRFKWVNDSYGHETGDALLIEVANRMRASLRTDDEVARIGGDEFLVLIRGVEDSELALSLVEKLHDRLTLPAQIGALQIDLRVSIGVAIYPQHGQSATALLASADEAMYLAKLRGRNRIHVLNAGEAKDRVAEVSTRTEILRAVKNDTFQLYFQPIVTLPEGRPVGAEALIRLFAANGDAIPPESFMATAERHGLADVIGEKVIEMALLAAGAWPGLRTGKLPYLSLNVASSQLNYGSFSSESIQEVCLRHEFDPKRLMIEVIERTVIDTNTVTRDTIASLRDLGVRLALDDFGTGYSAFAYLTEIQADLVKIDRRFISLLPDEAATKAVAEGLIAMCRALGITLLAEGVETQAQADFLADRGVEFCQGFLFARPMPQEDLLTYFHDHM